MQLSNEFYRSKSSIRIKSKEIFQYVLIRGSLFVQGVWIHGKFGRILQIVSIYAPTRNSIWPNTRKTCSNTPFSKHFNLHIYWSLILIYPFYNREICQSILIGAFSRNSIRLNLSSIRTNLRHLSRSVKLIREAHLKPIRSKETFLINPYKSWIGRDR